MSGELNDCGSSLHSPKGLEYYKAELELIRSIIERENTLQVNRFGWFITAQGILFTALGFVFGLDPGKISSVPIWGEEESLIAILCFFGIFMAGTTLFSTWMADRALAAAYHCWNCVQRSGARKAGLCIDLFAVRPGRWRWLYQHKFMPGLAAASWITIAVLLGVKHFVQKV